MKVFFRADASLRMGIGHLMRCLTLAQALRERDVQIRFVCREYPGNLVDLLRQKGVPVTVLPAPTINDKTDSEDYAVWLGVTQIEDAEQTIEALNGENPDWLVVDHYGLSSEWEKRLRPYVGKVMVIDDLANRLHDSDFLLDQNYSFGGGQRYGGLVSETCKQMLGPRYALLHSEYALHRKTLRDRNGEVSRVLVFFGGSDPQNMTGLTLEALSHVELRHLDVDVVVGANNLHRNALEKQARERLQTKIYGLRPHLADLMAQADLAVGAGGVTTWERMCLGLPTVLISIAENQRPASEALAGAGLIHYGGHVSDITLDHLTQQLKMLIHSADSLATMAMQDQLLVDGLGGLRLVEALCPSDSHELRLRSACEQDIVLYYNWANDPQVRENAINTEAISWVTHQEWFTNKLHDENSHLFVLETAGLPVGQIRFDRQGDEVCIDYSLDVIVRGRGWGSNLVALGINRMQQIEPIGFRAIVKVGNEASCSVFRRLGFAEVSNAGRDKVFLLAPEHKRRGCKWA
ncbi:MAG: UDP-2,4-diacetamido-2,4,6-trideoxy-beta-L-altropyranose hydrolase [Desulfobulbaceae bacterium]|nr:UDP-2,4-diacetamido-2,4,6-trideoxy-beta-L-altropyranose hydrolase [Desulfobulbaceae bacterium]